MKIITCLNLQIEDLNQEQNNTVLQTEFLKLLLIKMTVFHLPLINNHFSVI